MNQFIPEEVRRSISGYLPTISRNITTGLFNMDEFINEALEYL